MIIGSTAAAWHFPDFRTPKDLDSFGQPVEGADSFWHESFPQKWYLAGVASPDLLYTIKVSHSFWDLHGTWGKHMADIVFFQSKGCKFDREAYDILRPVWNEKHGKKKTNLFQSKKDFFTDNVTRIYDHDSIHDSVAYGDRPLYEQILRENAEVAVDYEKFEAMSYEDKCRLVREEVYATALERWLIPSGYRFSPMGAYRLAMKKTITSLFKGKWALWIVLNYSQLQKPDSDYVARHKENSDRLVKL